MAHHKSAKKRIKTNLKANVRNRQYRSRMRSVMRRVVESKATDSLPSDLKAVTALQDRLVSKGIIHRNTAARRKSRLNKLFKEHMTQEQS